MCRFATLALIGLSGCDSIGSLPKTTASPTPTATPKPTATPTATPKTGQCSSSRIYITKGSDNGKYMTGAAILPGDTLVLKSSQNPYTYFTLDGLKGTAECPILITNEGGQVSLQNGISLSNSQYVKVLGNGDVGTKYGFHIEDPMSDGAAVTVAMKSAHIELAYIQIHKKTYGFWVKQEADCDPSVNAWLMDDVIVRDNEITNMNQEGMYMGSTSPNGQRDIYCCGLKACNSDSVGAKKLSPIPMRLGNISVFNNTVNYTNRAGIQLSGADHGSNNIHDNTVSNTGYEKNLSQGPGISLGGYTHAHVYKNTVTSTFNHGISALGSGVIQIDHNTVTKSGMIDTTTQGGMANIFFDTRTTNPVEKTTVLIEHNTIGQSTAANILIYDTAKTISGSGNIICDTAGSTDIVNTMSYSKACP